MNPRRFNRPPLLGAGEFVTTRESRASRANVAIPQNYDPYRSTGINPAKQEGDEGVSTAFLTRPVNSVDFYETGGTLTISPDQLVEIGTHSMTIQQGRRAILTRVDVIFDPIYPASTLVSMVHQLTVNNLVQSFNDALTYDQIMTMQTYLLIEEGSVLAVTSTRTSTLSIADRINQGAPNYSPSYNVRFYGVMLSKRPIPLQFEVVGNPGAIK